MAVFDEPKMRRYGKLSSVFTPGAPVHSRDLFAGRFDQIMQVTSALSQPGQHVVLYGERGVGKTSLANVLTEFVYPAGNHILESARVNCTTQDDFKTIWTKVFRGSRLDLPEAWQYQAPDPDEIRFRLAQIDRPFVIVLDEFDRIEDDETLSLIADTIKALSDHAVQTKVVIVGVAPSIDQLIGEHESVQRAIEEVLIPRMSDAEMADIIKNGLDAVDMTIAPPAQRAITRLAEGLPHYVHLLALNSAQRAVQDDRDHIATEDVREAIRIAVSRHSLLRDYQTAVQSPRPNNLFSRVLVACALAEKNMLGQFTAAAVRIPMSKIMRAKYDIPAFSPHLKAFTEVDRGCVLVREGAERRYTYRFRNPLLQPFAVLTALSDGTLPPEYEAELFQ